MFGRTMPTPFSLPVPNHSLTRPAFRAYLCIQLGNNGRSRIWDISVPNHSLTPQAFRACLCIQLGNNGSSRIWDTSVPNHSLTPQAFRAHLCIQLGNNGSSRIWDTPRVEPGLAEGKQGVNQDSRGSKVKKGCSGRWVLYGTSPTAPLPLGYKRHDLPSSHELTRSLCLFDLSWQGGSVEGKVPICSFLWQVPMVHPMIFYIFHSRVPFLRASTGRTSLPAQADVARQTLSELPRRKRDWTKLPACNTSALGCPVEGFRIESPRQSACVDPGQRVVLVGTAGHQLPTQELPIATQRDCIEAQEDGSHPYSDFQRPTHPESFTLLESS